MTGSTARVGAPAHPTFAQVKGLLQTNRLAVALRLAGARTMLVHIANIKLSVLASTRDHLNATKRLKDFALR